MSEIHKIMDWIRSRAKTDSRVNELFDTLGKMVYLTELLEAYRNDQLTAEADLTDETIRDWSKKVLYGWASYLGGEGRWDDIGATPPDGVIDCIFSQIQVTLLGYADKPGEANAKTEQLDRMLRVRK